MESLEKKRNNSCGKRKKRPRYCVYIRAEEARPYDIAVSLDGFVRYLNRRYKDNVLKKQINEYARAC